jgi:hypothetical protein
MSTEKGQHIVCEFAVNVINIKIKEPAADLLLSLLQHDINVLSF